MPNIQHGLVKKIRAGKQSSVSPVDGVGTCPIVSLWPLYEQEERPACKLASNPPMISRYKECCSAITCRTSQVMRSKMFFLNCRVHPTALDQRLTNTLRLTAWTHWAAAGECHAVSFSFSRNSFEGLVVAIHYSISPALKGGRSIHDKLIPLFFRIVLRFLDIAFMPMQRFSELQHALCPWRQPLAGNRYTSWPYFRQFLTWNIGHNTESCLFKILRRIDGPFIDCPVHIVSFQTADFRDRTGTMNWLLCLPHIYVYSGSDLY